MNGTELQQQSDCVRRVAPALTEAKVSQEAPANNYLSICTRPMARPPLRCGVIGTIGVLHFDHYK